MIDIFTDRTDAGQRLSERLAGLDLSDAVVLAIPNGGIPVGFEIAERLKLPFDIVVPRKLPIPWNPEAGFGAVTGDGTVVINDALVNELRLTKSQVEDVVGAVGESVRQREQILRKVLPPTDICGKSTLIVDDGIASGYTMLAAVNSARSAGVRKVTIAAPVASEPAVRLLRDSADELICLIESHHLPFAVADYYLNWRDLTEEDALEYLSRVSKRQASRPV